MIDSCTMKYAEKKSGDGGCVYASVLDGNTLTLTNTEIIGCSTDGNGVGVCVLIGSGASVIFSDSSFTDCSASGEGGCVYSLLLDSTVCFDISSSFFTSLNAGTGSCVYIECGMVDEITRSGGFGNWTFDSIRGYGEKVYVKCNTMSTEGGGVIEGPLVVFVYPPILTSAEVEVERDGTGEMCVYGMYFEEWIGCRMWIEEEVELVIEVDGVNEEGNIVVSLDADLIAVLMQECSKTVRLRVDVLEMEFGEVDVTLTGSSDIT